MAGVVTAYPAPDIHANRPAANSGAVFYSCTTHSKVYRSDGSSWIDWLTLPSSGLSDPMTTRGDSIIRNSSNVTSRLAVGSADTVMKSDGTDPSWGKVLPANLDVSADNTTANATSGHHGLLPKLDGNSAHALLGDGTWGSVGGAGANAHNENDAAVLVNATSTGDAGSRADHFAGTSLSGSWTGEGTAASQGPTVKYSSVGVRQASGTHFEYQAFTPSGAFRVECRMRAPLGSCAFIVKDSAAGSGGDGVLTWFGSGLALETYSKTSGSDSLQNSAGTNSGAGWVYLSIERNGSNSWTTQYSVDRALWVTITTGLSKTLTVAKFGLQFASVGAVDFVDVVS